MNEERFWRKVDFADCWEWVAGTNAYGYGYFRTSGGARVAHRVAYELLVGPIPTGLQLDHLCRNRRCVNPDHLEPVTQAENLRRGAGSNGALRPRPNTCRNGGHDYPGSGACRECHREAQRRYKAKRKAAA